MIAVCLFTAVACSKEELTEENALTRGISKADSSNLDSGKVRYCSVVIDTTWGGDTVIHF